MLNLGRQQTNIFLILISIIIVLTIILFTDNSKTPSLELAEEGKPVDEDIDNMFEDHNKTPEEPTSSMIKVYITGQIKNPGVLEVEEGSRLIDVIDLAGGMLEEADTNRINLALKVQDEGMYIIPKIGEEVEELTGEGLLGEQGNEKRVNINRATIDELQTLHGIGPAKAKAIVDYRENQGLFKDIEDIKNVSGIGEKTFEQIRDSITTK